MPRKVSVGREVGLLRGRALAPHIHEGRLRVQLHWISSSPIGLKKCQRVVQQQLKAGTKHARKLNHGSTGRDSDLRSQNFMSHIITCC